MHGVKSSHYLADDEPRCDSGFPRSHDVPNLPGCVLAPLSGEYHQTLLQIFTGHSSENYAWKTWYISVCIMVQCNIYCVYLPYC